MISKRGSKYKTHEFIFSLEDAKKITKQDVLKEIGEVPKLKIHCSFLAEEALKTAIKNYENGK